MNTNECLFTREFIIIYTYTSSIIIYLILNLFFAYIRVIQIQYNRNNFI